MPLLPLLLLAWPLAEIAAFVVVGREIGVLATIGLILLTAIGGALLLRVQGFGALRRVQADMDAGRDPGREIVSGVMILFAGMLLLLPGFLTDIVGLLLFLPPVRTFVWRRLKNRISIISFPGGFGSSGFGPTGGRSGPTIALDPDDYSRTGPQKRDGSSRDSGSGSPWRQIDHDS